MELSRKEMTRKSIEKLLSKAEANLTKWEEEKAWQESLGYVNYAKVYGGINRATEGIEEYKNLLQALDEGKKVYRTRNGSSYIQSRQDIWTHWEIV